MYITRHKILHRLNEESSILVNTLSGALDLIENRYLPLLDDPQALAANPDILSALSSRGYIYKSKRDEEIALEQLFAAQKGICPPTAFVICPTYACNLRCAYCFEGSLTTEATRALTTDEVDLIFSAIKRIAPENASIVLFGGEPFLPKNQSIIKYIIDSAVKRGFSIGAVTNGVNLVNFLDILSANRKNIEDIQVTVDGPAAVHDLRRPKAGGRGTFADIVKGIDQALALSLRIRMRVNVDRQNIGHLLELGDFIARKGWDKNPNFVALLAPIEDHTGCDPEYRLLEDKLAAAWFKLKDRHPQLGEIFQSRLFRNLDHIISALSGNRPTAPRFEYCESNHLGCYTFGTDGLIYLCAEAIGDSRTAVGRYYPDFSLNKDVVNLWNNRSILTLEKCRECSVATFCGGGCAYAAIRINGALDKPHCNGAEKTVHAYLEATKHKLLAL